MITAGSNIRKQYISGKMKEEDIKKIFNKKYDVWIKKILPDVELTGTTIDDKSSDVSKKQQSNILTMQKIFGFEVLPSLIQQFCLTHNQPL